MTSIRTGLQELNLRSWVELPRRSAAETHLVLPKGADVLELCHWAAQKGFYLCTMVACDERMLEDNSFKLYTILSGPNHQLVILEHSLEQDSFQYLSLREHFPGVAPLERAAKDMFGLTPGNAPIDGRFLLHQSPYPSDLYPLRRNRAYPRLCKQIADYQAEGERAAELPYGMLRLVVGPIHAGVIEAGQFSFFVAGEVVEDLSIRLGYKHRGVEKLFETDYMLTTGQQLAECIAGDSTFAHSMAYSQAVESLVDLQLPLAALYWRGLLLEMERLYNHIGDVAALVHDVAYDLIASELAVLRERALRINEALTGHRLLRGVNHPGGVDVRHPERLPDASRDLAQIARQFLGWVNKHVLTNSTCRNRYLTTGILTREEAKGIGATGLPARASGLWDHDFRLRHPEGVYALPTFATGLRDLVQGTFVDPGGNLLPSKSSRTVPVYQADLTGDVYARLLVRVGEVETSAKIIELLANGLKALGNEAPISSGEEFISELQSVDNFETGLGYVEGWRGDIFYTIWKGPGGTIFRCQPRDPSLYNWPALRLAVIRKLQRADNGNRGGSHYRENILADFPIINKSFNLSYAANDC